ncbi:ribosomal protein S18-alanine N-acetyltransferase [candidate division WOR-3 bacterium]|nr:ribosomal protein S18-alanine N-acetyltransferase [candidate division WOR-3 bacterium]
MLPADLGRIAAIEETSFSAPWSLAMLAAAMHFSGSLNYVIQIGDEIAGYMFARLVSEELHIINLAVDPRMRRKGLGLKLLHDVLNQATLAGARWAYLEVRTANLAAIRLYQKQGFRIIRKHHGYYEDGSDAYEMGLIITHDKEAR